MFIPALGATVAELPADTKNAHSHRALACAQMLALLLIVNSMCYGAIPLLAGPAAQD